MTFEYITPEEAIDHEGLRMVVVGGIPSPWGEAAKGIFHIKGIDWKAVRLDYQSEALRKWTRRLDGPVVAYNDEPHRHSFFDILLLAERIAPSPSLLPEDPKARALAFGLAHEFCGENGLGWARRLQAIQWGLAGKGGFPRPASEYLARKYSHSIESEEVVGNRILELLRMISNHLNAQKKDGSAFYIGNELSAVDIYSATMMAMFRPLPEEQCAMSDVMRAPLEQTSPEIDAALDPVLIEHRDMMYRNHLELPLSL